MYYSNLDRMFDSIFGGDPNQILWPSSVIRSDEDTTYEINQTKDGAYLLFEVPGFNKTNLKVELEGGNLILDGTRTYKVNGEEKTKKISKSFNLGKGYDPSSVEATIDDGILTVFIPNYKKQEKKRISLL
jgi:HSP20 family molecular chaperone IbpA